MIWEENPLFLETPICMLRDWMYVWLVQWCMYDFFPCFFAKDRRCYMTSFEVCHLWLSCIDCWTLRWVVASRTWKLRRKIRRYGTCKFPGACNAWRASIPYKNTFCFSNSTHVFRKDFRLFFFQISVISWDFWKFKSLKKASYRFWED